MATMPQRTMTMSPDAGAAPMTGPPAPHDPHAADALLRDLWMAGGLAVTVIAFARIAWKVVRAIWLAAWRPVATAAKAVGEPWLHKQVRTTGEIVFTDVIGDSRAARSGVEELRSNERLRDERIAHLCDTMARLEHGLEVLTDAVNRLALALGTSGGRVGSYDRRGDDRL